MAVRGRRRDRFGYKRWRLKIENQLVLSALESALQKDAEHRLTSRGRSALGLLPAGTSALHKQAVTFCLDQANGLFTAVRQTKEKAGKSEQVVSFVTITESGIAALFENAKVDRYQELLDTSAAPHRQAALSVCRQIVERRLQSCALERSVIAKEERDISEFVRNLAEERLKQLELERRRLETESAAAEALVDQLRIGPTEAALPPKPVSPPPVPTRDEDLDFQRNTARELVYAWRDADSPEAKALLARAMLNAGLHEVGKVGETVTFDNRQHETDQDLEAGDSASIIVPGWQLTNSRGRLLLARARVARRVAKKEVGTNVGHG